MKKTLAIALVLVMVLSCVGAIFASAEEAKPVFVFNVNGVNGEIAGEDAWIFTTQDAYNNGNPKWAITVLLEVEADGALKVKQDGIAGQGAVPDVKIGDGVIALVVHSSTSNLEEKDQYPNVEGKLAALDAKAGMYVVLDGIDLDKAEGSGTASLYATKPAAAGSEESKEESKEPEYVDVEEVINVDGKLDDTGYTKATWVTDSLWQQAGAPAPADVTGKFTTRSDDDTIYVAVEIKNVPAPHVTTGYPGADAATDTQIEGYAQKGASLVRVWIRQDDAVRYAFDVQYLGAEKGWIPVRVIYTAGNSTLTLAQFTENTKIAIEYVDKTLTAEIAFKRADFGITGEYSMFITYCDNFDDLVTEERPESYQGFHLVNKAAETSEESGVIINYSGDKNTAPYVKFAAESTKLGSYKEPAKQDPAEPTYAEKIEALLGDKIENADFEISLTSSVEKNAEGKLIMTAVLTVSKINENVKMLALNATVRYDAERMTLTNGTVATGEDKNSLDCVTKKPADWENLTPNANNQKKEGEIEVSVVNPNDSTPYLTLDDNVVLTFTFELKAGYTEAAVWVVNGEVTSLYEPNPEVDTDEAAEYVGNGDYTVGSYVEETPSAPESSEPASSATAPTGDAGILVFAVLGILAVAGAATVIKVRH